MTERKTIYIHPGEVLKEEFLVPLGISVNRLATSLGVPASRVYAILNGNRGVTAELAILLARVFQTTPEFWINLQTHHDLNVAKHSIPGARMRRAARLARHLRIQEAYGQKLLELKGTIDPNIDLEF
jgi:addiction module HigA family antidote